MRGRRREGPCGASRRPTDRASWVTPPQGRSAQGAASADPSSAAGTAQRPQVGVRRRTSKVTRVVATTTIEVHWLPVRPAVGDVDPEEQKREQGGDGGEIVERGEMNALADDGVAGRGAVGAVQRNPRASPVGLPRWPATTRSPMRMPGARPARRHPSPATTTAVRGASRGWRRGSLRRCRRVGTPRLPRPSRSRAARCVITGVVDDVSEAGADEGADRWHARASRWPARR